MAKVFQPQAPTPPYVPPPPPGNTEDSKKKIEDARIAELRAKGRAATSMTGGQGLTDPAPTSKRTLTGV